MQQPLQPPFHPLQHAQHQTIQQSQHSTHFSHICTHPSHVQDLSLQHQTQAIPPHLACLQSLSGVNLGGRLHALVSPILKDAQYFAIAYSLYIHSIIQDV